MLSAATSTCRGVATCLCRSPAATGREPAIVATEQEISASLLEWLQEFGPIEGHLGKPLRVWPDVSAQT